MNTNFVCATALRAPSALRSVARYRCPLARRAPRTKGTEYTIKPLPPGGPAPRLADGHPDLTGHWFPNGAGQGVSGRFGVDPAATGTFDPKVTPEERPRVPAVGAGKNQGDDADRARAVEVVGELPAARRSRDLAAEPVHDVDGPQAGPAGAAVRSAEQLAGHSPRWPPAPEVSRAVLSRQQHRALGGRHAGGRIDRVRRPNLHHAQRLVPQRRAARHRALHAARR